MKDMSIIANKKIINKETNEVRLVVKIDEENRKIFSVPVDEPAAEPSGMAGSQPHFGQVIRRDHKASVIANGIRAFGNFNEYPSSYDCIDI